MRAGNRNKFSYPHVTTRAQINANPFPYFTVLESNFCDKIRIFFLFYIVTPTSVILQYQQHIFGL